MDMLLHVGSKCAHADSAVVQALFEELQSIAAVQTNDSEKSKKYGIQKLPFNEKSIADYIEKCSELVLALSTALAATCLI